MKNTIFIIVVIVVLLVVGWFGYVILQKNITSRPAPDGFFVVGGLNVGGPLEQAWTGFIKGMEDLGYREGRNIEYRYQTNVQGGDAEYAELSKGLLQGNIHLLVGFGVGAAKGAKMAAEELQSETPILFINVSDPVGNGLAKSISAPGGNITGVTPANEIVSGRRLEIFTEAVPGLKRIFFPYNNAKTAGLEEVKKTALSLGVALEEHRLDTAAEVLPYLNSLILRQGDGILRATDQIMAVALPGVIKFGIDHKIPVADSSSSGVALGAFIGYGVNFEDEGKQGARLADKILRGVAHPRSIPIELPEHFEFSINLQTAEKIGIEVPKNILERADVIYPIR